MTERDFTPKERLRLWTPYWAGDPPPISPLPPELTPPLWEYLVDGVLELIR
jgi:hypothetical protein